MSSSLEERSTVANENFVAMISEINILESDGTWRIDSVATKHVCKDRNLFKTFEKIEDGNVL